MTPTVVKSEPKKQRTGTTYDWILEDFEEDGKPDVANRSLASVSYLLPLLDGLHYGRYLFMQVGLWTFLVSSLRRSPHTAAWM